MDVPPQASCVKVEASMSRTTSTSNSSSASNSSADSSSSSDSSSTINSFMVKEVEFVLCIHRTKRPDEHPERLPDEVRTCPFSSFSFSLDLLSPLRPLKLLASFGINSEDDIFLVPCSRRQMVSRIQDKVEEAIATQNNHLKIFLTMSWLYYDCPPELQADMNGVLEGLMRMQWEREENRSDAPPPQEEASMSEEEAEVDVDAMSEEEVEVDAMSEEEVEVDAMEEEEAAWGRRRRYQ